MYSIAFISVERLHAVCWPFKHRMLKRWHYALTMSLTWLVGATVALVSNEILPDRIGLWEGLNVRTVFALIPIIVTIAAYRFLWLNRKGHVTKTRKEKNNSIASTLLVVTVVIICTWSPFILLVRILGYMRSLHPDKYRSLPSSEVLVALHFTKLLQYSNSSVNPFIYALRIHSFRDKALDTLCCSKVRKDCIITPSRNTTKTPLSSSSVMNSNPTIKYGNKNSNKTPLNLLPINNYD